MKVDRLLQADQDSKSDNSLANCFGDSYLVRKNKIYQNLRNLCLQEDFRFSSEFNANYTALPLTQLENILQQKCIPYHDNVSVLKLLDSQLGDLDWQEVAENLKQNFVMHESCHAVVRAGLQKLGVAKSTFTLLLEESFANTSELFLILEASETTHKIFVDLNSYSAVFEIRTNLAKICRDIGYEKTFVFFVLGYLHSNYHFDVLAEKDFLQLVGIVDNIFDKKTEQESFKALKALLKICFTLDENFKKVTTGLFLRLNHYPSEKNQFGSTSYLQNLKPQIRNLVRQLAARAVKGMK